MLRTALVSGLERGELEAAMATHVCSDSGSGLTLTVVHTASFLASLHSFPVNPTSKSVFSATAPCRPVSYVNLRSAALTFDSEERECQSMLRYVNVMSRKQKLLRRGWCIG